MRLWLLLLAADVVLLFPLWLAVGGPWWMWIATSVIVASTGYAFGRSAT